MPSPHRLSRLDFNHFKVERRLSGAFLSLGVGVVSQRIRGGFACVVSKKVARKAVDRNRIKRRVRAIMREVTLSGPLVVIVYAKPGASHATMQDLREDIMALLGRFN